MSSENIASKADSRLMRVNPGFIYENDPDIINNNFHFCKMNLGVLSALGIAKLDFYNQFKNTEMLNWSGAIKNTMIYALLVSRFLSSRSEVVIKTTCNE